jgi:hypothetical protein
MPGGTGNIRPSDNPHPFTSENQPKNRRKSTKFLTDLLTKELKGKKRQIEVEGENEEGEMVKVKITMPTRETIVHALLKQASKGNIHAIKEVFDRVEGKTLQPVGLQDKDGNDIPLNIIFQQADNCEPIEG